MSKLAGRISTRELRPEPLPLGGIRMTVPLVAAKGHSQPPDGHACDPLYVSPAQGLFKVIIRRNLANKLAFPKT